MTLTVVPLTPVQCEQLHAAYAQGEITSVVLTATANLVGTALTRRSMYLELLPLAPIHPVHFPFSGNRDYAMQLVTNGVSYGLFSHETFGPGDDRQGRPQPRRLELIQHADLPFLGVTRPPSARQVDRLYVDLIQFLADGFRQADLSAAHRQFYLQMPGRQPPLTAEESAILAGASAHAILEPCRTSTPRSRPHP